MAEPFFRQVAELAMAALDVPVVAMKLADPETLWVAARGEQRNSETLTATLQDSTLFQRVTRSPNAVISDIQTQDRLAALIDLEQFPFRFFASRALAPAAGQLCVLDEQPRTLQPHHEDVLHTLVDMVQAEMERKRATERRRRDAALQDRLQRVLQMIASDEPLDLALEALAYLVETQFTGAAVAIHWFDAEAGTLHPLAAPSLPEVFFAASEGLPADAEAGAMGMAAQHGEEALVPELAPQIHWDELRTVLTEAGFTTSWSLPIPSTDDAPSRGAISVFLPTAFTPTADVRQTLSMAAQIAGVALERDRDRSALALAHRRYQHYMAQSTEGVYRVDLSPPVRAEQSLKAQIQQVFERAYIADCNDVFAQQHGFVQASDVVGRPLLDLYGEGQDLAQLPILRALDHGGQLHDAESQEVDQQGATHWFRNTLRCDIDDGAIVSIWGAQRDVTQRKHIEYALRESEHRYRTLADMESDLVLVHDETTIRAVNPAGAALLGMPSCEAAAGQPLADFFASETIEQLFERARMPESGQTPETHEVTLHLAQGGACTAAVSTCNVLYGGEPAMLTVGRDLTAHRQREQSILAAKARAEQAQAKAESLSHLKSAFVANMNHEIRTPLTAIIGFTEILSEEIESPTGMDVHDLVSHIRSSGQRLLWTLDSMLNLSRMEAGELELRPAPINLVKEVGQLLEVFRQMAHDKELELMLDAGSDEVHATLDRMALERVVGNLITAAIRETDRGVIRIQVRKHEAGAEVAVIGGNEHRGERISYAPGDEGAEHSGSEDSLGLAVVHGLLERMNAQLAIETLPEEGTTYRVQFHSADEVALYQALQLITRDAAPAA